MAKKVNVTPLHDRVIVKAAPAEEKTAGGIIIPDTAKEKPQRGTVIAAGPGKKDEQVISGKGIFSVYNRLEDPNNGKNTITVFFDRGQRDGVWTLRLYGKEVSDGRFDAWIERDERGQSQFVKTNDGSYWISNEYTLGSIACGKKTIVVGSYDAHDKPEFPLAESTSSGPTIDGRNKPEISAPGERVLAAQSETQVLRRRQSGTSMAAPAVTGTVALILAEVKARGISLTVDQIREIVTLATHNDTIPDKGWDPRFGYGRICAAKAVAIVSGLATDHEKKQELVKAVKSSGNPRHKRGEGSGYGGKNTKQRRSEGKE